MWRGLVLNRAVQQFLQDAHWGDLDYLLIDLPPGTGDIQMGLARLLPRTELLVVTTPPVAAQKVAARAADMARRGYLRVAGVIENMSDFTCEHGTTYALFGSGGGERLAHGLGVPLVGSIPLHPDVAAGGDAGVPVALAGDAASSAASSRRWPASSPRTWRRSWTCRAARPASWSGWRRRWPRGTRRRLSTTFRAAVPRRRSIRRSGRGPAALDAVLRPARSSAGTPCPPGPTPAGAPTARSGRPGAASPSRRRRPRAAARRPSPRPGRPGRPRCARGVPAGARRGASTTSGTWSISRPWPGRQRAEGGVASRRRARLARYWCRSPSGGRMTTVEPCMTWSPVSSRAALLDEPAQVVRGVAGRVEGPQRQVRPCAAAPGAGQRSTPRRRARRARSPRRARSRRPGRPWPRPARPRPGHGRRGCG